MLIAAIWINSFWPWPKDGGGAGGASPLPVAYCAHMTATVGDVIGRTFTIEMRGPHHYDDGVGGVDGGSNSLENVDVHGFGHDNGAGDVPEESEERDHIAHHFGKYLPHQLLIL